MNTHQQPSSKEWALSQYDIYHNDNVVLPRHAFEEIIDKLLTSHSEAIRERVIMMVKPLTPDGADTKFTNLYESIAYNQALDEILALLNDIAV